MERPEDYLYYCYQGDDRIVRIRKIPCEDLSGNSSEVVQGDNDEVVFAKYTLRDGSSIEVDSLKGEHLLCTASLDPERLKNMIANETYEMFNETTADYTMDQRFTFSKN